MADLQHLETTRLELSAADPERDLSELFPIWSDPASWEHAPDYRHTQPEQTRGFLERAAANWSEHGLGYWTVRLRDGGEVIGSGGAQRHVTGAWNLLWRIAPAMQGRGFATELGRSAITAAHVVDGTVPVIAWIRSNNPSSQRVAERLGLIAHAESVDDGDGLVRIPYSDRLLTPGAGDPHLTAPLPSDTTPDRQRKPEASIGVRAMS